MCILFFYVGGQSQVPKEGLNTQQPIAVKVYCVLKGIEPDCAQPLQVSPGLPAG